MKCGKLTSSSAGWFAAEPMLSIVLAVVVAAAADVGLVELVAAEAAGCSD